MPVNGIQTGFVQLNFSGFRFPENLGSLSQNRVSAAIVVNIVMIAVRFEMAPRPDPSQTHH
jgi:hypothetical protein